MVERFGLTVIKAAYYFFIILYDYISWDSIGIVKSFTDGGAGASLGAVEAECVLSIGAVSGRRCLLGRS